MVIALSKTGLGDGDLPAWLLFAQPVRKLPCFDPNQLIVDSNR